MERVREPLYIGATCAATSAHIRPLDAVLVALDALEESPCSWCQGLLRLIKAHLEATAIPVESGVLN